MQKGFTLIELLAVLAILSLIALITTPIITNVIDKGRESSFQNSVQSLVDIVNMDYNEYGRVGSVTYTFNNDLICKACDGTSDVTLDYDGDLEATGTIVKDGQNITLNISNDKYSATYNKKVIVNKK